MYVVFTCWFFGLKFTAMSGCFSKSLLTRTACQHEKSDIMLTMNGNRKKNEDNKRHILAIIPENEEL